MTLFTSIVFFVIVSYFVLSINKVSDIYLNNTQETILRMRKDFLKYTVNNLISQIDNKIKIKTAYMDKLVSNTSVIINLKMSMSNQEFHDFYLNFFQSNTDYNFWTVLLWDAKENKTIYDSQNIAGNSWKVTMDNIQAKLASYKIVHHGNQTAVYGISKNYVNEIVKAEMAEAIRDTRFNDNSYIWVNEILNYNGGKNYAIRRVHPNLPKTEGMYLSTDMTDMKGNLPYLKELQGINKNGELFFSYYFKELENDTVSEKLTYAKLYKRFNWVIAMGTYEKDLNTSIQQTNEESKKLVSKLMLNSVLLFIFILLLSYSLIMLIEKLYSRHSKKILESEINQDLLTKADSRRSGTKSLSDAFKDYKQKGYNSAVMMFDLDYFKHINDTYGHATGDKALVETVNAISHIIRSSDKLIRWGGDEFIIIIFGLQEGNGIMYGESILSVVSTVKIKMDTDEITPSLSIGVSYFKETDTDYTDVLRRVDEAVYKSKSNGRNQVNQVL